MLKNRWRFSIVWKLQKFIRDLRRVLTPPLDDWYNYVPIDHVSGLSIFNVC